MRSLWGPRRRETARNLGAQGDPLAPAIVTALSMGVPISGTARGDRRGECVASDRGLLLIEGKALLYLKAGSPAHAPEIDHQVPNRYHPL